MVLHSEVSCGQCTAALMRPGTGPHQIVQLMVRCSKKVVVDNCLWLWLQVATSTEVYVFHVKHFAPGVKVGADLRTVERALRPLLPLLTSSAVFKVGVGVVGDVSLLQRFVRDLECRYVFAFVEDLLCV